MQVQFSDQFESQECISCGISFALTATLVKHLRATKREFRCPNGHTQSYVAATETERKIKALEDRVRTLEDEIVMRKGWAADKDDKIAELSRSNVSLRGVITKLKTKR